MQNIPHLLSAFRLVVAPLAAWMAFEGHRDAFFLLIIASLFTDLVDGPIARWLDQESHFGAKLDTVADGVTLLAGIVGLFLLEVDTLRPELPWLALFLASYGAAALTGLVKFGVLPAYHLYLSKLAAVGAALFFIAFYLTGYSRVFFLAVIGLGGLANVESLLLTLRLRRFRTDIPSIFAVPARRDGGP